MIRVFPLAAVLALAAPVHAADAEGCKDPALFNRMPGYAIADCSSTQFDAMTFQTKVSAECAAPETTIEGPTAIYDYRLEEGRKPASPLQIQRNFANAVRAAGGTVVAEGGATTSDRPLCRDGSTRDRAVLLRFTRGKAEVWALVSPYDNGGGYELHMVEKQAMSQDIAARDLLGEMRQKGIVSLQVHFDTAQATIQAESQGQLDQVAQMLAQAPELKVEIGGHTDNAGTPDGNLKLSQARAAAVMQALAQRGVAAARMSAKGYGQTVPVADNRTEEGRAKNRRVELVKR